MKILLSNDDGYNAVGITTLREHLVKQDFVDKIILIAPDRNRSGASNSLTLDMPLKLQEIEPLTYAVDGTPTDCVHLALNGALEMINPNNLDLVLSGINAGANMGDDVLYSGTVAAAMEGRFLGKNALAISLCGNKNFDSAAQIVVDILQNLEDMILQSKISSTIFNINIPDVPYKKLNGVQMTRLGSRHISEPVVPSYDPRGRKIYWIGAAGKAVDFALGTDFYAVKNNFVSITPMHVDLTDYKDLDKLQSWVDKQNNPNS